MGRLLALGALALALAFAGCGGHPRDRGRIVFGLNSGIGYDLYAIGANGADRHPLVHTIDDELQPAVTRDGRRLAYWYGGFEGPYAQKLYVANGDGTGRRELFREREATAVGSPSWSPDGRRLAVVVRSELSVVDAGDGTITPLVRASEGAGASWSPDGDSIAFARGHEIWVVDVDGTGARRVTGRAVEPQWSPDGKTILFVLPTQNGIGFVRPDGTARRIVAIGALGAAWSPDSRQVAVARTELGKRGIWTMDRDGTHRRRLFESSDIDSGIAWGL